MDPVYISRSNCKCRFADVSIRVRNAVCQESQWLGCTLFSRRCKKDTFLVPCVLGWIVEGSGLGDLLFGRVWVKTDRYLTWEYGVLCPQPRAQNLPAEFPSFTMCPNPYPYSVWLPFRYASSLLLIQKKLGMNFVC